MCRIMLVIVFLFSSVNLSYAKALNYNNAFLTSLKLSENVDYSSFIEGYMRVFRNDVWQRHHNDEFTFEEKKNESIEILSEQVEDFDMSDPFVITFSTNFGRYDFNENTFSYRPLLQGAHFPVESNYLRLLKLTIDNVDFIEDIYMEESEARKFLDSRKSVTGSIDRSLNITIEVIPDSLDGNKIHSNIVSYKLSGRRGEIVFEKNSF